MARDRVRTDEHPLPPRLASRRTRAVQRDVAAKQWVCACFEREVRTNQPLLRTTLLELSPRFGRVPAHEHPVLHVEPRSRGGMQRTGGIEMDEFSRLGRTRRPAPRSRDERPPAAL